MEVVRLGRLVLELSFVLNDEAGSGVEAAVVVERVVVEQVFGGAAVVGVLRALEDQGHGLGNAIMLVCPVLLVRSIAIRALCRGFS